MIKHGDNRIWKRKKDDDIVNQWVLCGVLWCGVVCYGVVWCGVLWCGVVWCGGYYFVPRDDSEARTAPGPDCSLAFVQIVVLRHVQPWT